MRIQVLYFKGCPNYEPAIELISSVVPNAIIEPVEIKTQEEAVRTRFLGSPTVQVEGVDVEPDARARTDFGFACRTYNGSGVPSRQLVASAVELCSPSTLTQPGIHWLGAGSLAAAVIASACCWIPLLLLGSGMSVMLSSTLEVLRPWLLAGSVALLGAGFYLAHRGQSCCAPRARRLNWAMSSLALALVAACALFPSYANSLMCSIGGAACCAPTSEARASTGASTVRQVALADEKTSVTVLSEDLHELKDAFNSDKNAVRVMLIVSPRCPACRAGASVVQKEALDQTRSDKLKVYVVWINRFFGDSLKAAQEATELVPDKRARHFWDGRGVLGKQYGRVVQLPRAKQFAWDVYFVFGSKTQWDTDPPIPIYWMHQLGGQETGNLLDGKKFQQAIAEQLP